MKLKELSLKDKTLFCKFLNLKRHQLSVYAFENIYIWTALFKIEWAIIDRNLCVFFRDNTGSFLYLPPLGKKRSAKALSESFRIMDGFNSNKSISRVENLEEQDLMFYRNLGFKLIEKSCDYLCKRADLAGLRGNKFKSKRSSCNYFTKHYQFEYCVLTPRDSRDCLRLYRLWARQRTRVERDQVYRGMIQDSKACLELLLKNYAKLDFIGRIVKIGKRARAFTLGFRLTLKTFCVLYEITDLKVKGLAQFIFRRSSEELKSYRYINIMDDSGLENLKKVKLSYHPSRVIPAYIAQRQDV